MADKDAEDLPPKHPLFHPFSRRFHLLLLILAGFCMTSYMRSNLGVTMTCMVNSTAVALKNLQKISQNGTGQVVGVPPQCRLNSNLTEGHINDYGGTLEWDNDHQKEMFKGTFWGSFITVLISGYIADRTSPKYAFQFGFTLYVVCTVVFPWLVTNVGFGAALASRIVMGIGEGFVLPTISALVAPWFPAVERSTAASIYTSGNQLAGFFGSPLAAYLCASSWKWPSVFYVCGIVGVIWSVLWCVTVSDTPSDCKCISEKERKYLEANIFKKPENREGVRVPWKAILTSGPVWAIFISQCAANFVVVLLQSYTPTYYKEVLYMKLTDNGLYGALPNLFLCTSKITWGMMMDRLKRKNILTPTQACKFSQWFSNITMAVVFLCLAFFVDCTRPGLAVVLMCLYGIAFSSTVSGFFTSLLSIAPMYAGTLSSLAMLFGIIGRITAPDLVGLVKKNGTVEEWRIIFITLAAVSMISGIAFGILGSAEIQPWAQPRSVIAVEQESLIIAKRAKQLQSSVRPLIKSDALSLDLDDVRLNGDRKGTV